MDASAYIAIVIAVIGTIALYFIKKATKEQY